MLELKIDCTKSTAQIILIAFAIAVLMPDSSHSQVNGNRWFDKSDSLFTKKGSDHLEVYYFPSSLAERAIDDILRSREGAYTEITRFFDLDFPSTIRLYLFPDEETKYSVTGHKGPGGGFDNLIIEVYNDSIQLDPFHELVHVLGYKTGHPPALLDEGLAIYLSEELGNSAFFTLVGYPDKSINETLRLLAKKVKLISLSTLFSYNDISEASDVVLAYVQSASFVKYLIENYGREIFLELFAETRLNEIAENKNRFAKLYKMGLTRVEQEWLESLSL